MVLAGIISTLLAATDMQQMHPEAAAAPSPPAIPAGISVHFLLLLVVWAMVAVAVAYLMRAFKPKLIRGPERLLPEESVWWLLMIPCASMLVAGRVVGMVGLATLNLPKESTALLSNDLFEVGVFLLVVAFSIFARAGALQLIGLRLRQIPAGLFGGLLLIFVLFPLVALSGEAVARVYDWLHLKQADAHEVLQMLGNTTDRRVIIIGIATAALVAPLFEELLFRGMMQTLLSRLFSVSFGSQWLQTTGPKMAVAPGPQPVEPPAIGCRARWAAVLMTSAGFAASHMQPAWLVPLFLLSVGLGYVYERTGNLWMTIAAHSAFNSAQILIFLHT